MHVINIQRLLSRSQDDLEPIYCKIVRIKETIKSLGIRSHEWRFSGEAFIYDSPNVLKVPACLVFECSEAALAFRIRVGMV